MDEKEKVEIKPFTNGPYMVSGKFKLLDAKGNEVNATNPTYLCRCGHSKIKPFCDGSHRTVGWKE
ncbi:MAG: CDGSH iron-sulfur domain-containing protein [Sphingobacteriia bacterium]|nr:CDGSH iron-sulfur domain-containing protein [Sphingobacteriia bacterium]